MINKLSSYPVYYNYNSMDSTMVYQLVLQQLNQRKQLINLLPPFSTLLNPNSKLSTNRMNDQQIFSQIYKCITKSLQGHEHDKQSLLQDLEKDNENVQQEIEDENVQEEDEQNIQMQENEGEKKKHKKNKKNQDEVQNGQFQDIEQEERQDDEGLQQPVGSDEEDVGLYGEQIDQQQMESYQNQHDSQQDKEFQQEEKYLARKNGASYEQQNQIDEGEDIINDQFDQFREIQLQNKEQQVTNNEEKNDLQKQIQRLESGLISKKDWMLRGQVKATQRPVNSLLQYDLQFSTGIRLDQQITPQFNSELEKMIKQRVLDELYDDRVRYQHSQVLRQQYSSLKQVSTQKSKLGLSELYQSQFKNHLGLGQNKQDKLKTQILQAFKEVNYYLDSLSNFNFTPAPSTASKAEAVISEQKVPINMWNKGESVDVFIQRKMVSEKQENKQEKRVKNKRIARQRKKEVMKKKLNKKIQYGGMTKFEAKAIAKKSKNNLNQTNIKYNKSAKFFDQMNKEKNKKPNPNINKMKM